jgi:hypothetical protein
MHLLMYRYRDSNGNTFLLQVDGEAFLILEPAAVLQSVGSAQATCESLRCKLSIAHYMQLIAAFNSAIDNKVQHRELCNKQSGMITTLQDGQQRRYILCPNSSAQKDLEAELWAVWDAEK